MTHNNFIWKVSILMWHFCDPYIIVTDNFWFDILPTLDEQQICA